MNDDDRRYGEREIRKIFERAGTSARPQQLPSAEGLTLVELQSIGNEVGLSPQQIADAVDALALPPAHERRNFLGMPVGISRTASLSRLPDDREWELLIVELRSAFRVQGEDVSRGNLREWKHGQVGAYIEPSPNGCRIRLESAKREAILVNGFGVAWIVAGLITLITLARTGDLAGANALLPVISGAVGLAVLGYNKLRLSRWARTCAAQMQNIVDRARTSLPADPAFGAAQENESGDVRRTGTANGQT
jgi:hypothetical protein